MALCWRWQGLGIFFWGGRVICLVSSLKHKWKTCVRLWRQCCGFEGSHEQYQDETPPPPFFYQIFHWWIKHVGAWTCSKCWVMGPTLFMCLTSFLHWRTDSILMLFLTWTLNPSVGSSLVARNWSPAAGCGGGGVESVGWFPTYRTSSSLRMLTCNRVLGATGEEQQGEFISRRMDKNTNALEETGTPHSSIWDVKTNMFHWIVLIRKSYIRIRTAVGLQESVVRETSNLPW